MIILVIIFTIAMPVKEVIPKTDCKIVKCWYA